ncbi:MAG: hypothetical protein NTV23_07890 [Propionibacteriales bacterium]|nr:hypothetical protein [Propionibacteriales bacterium]
MTTINAEAPVVAAKRDTMPRAASRDGVAPLKGNAAQKLHQVLFIAGAVLLPGGLIVIGLGWYGVANTPYEYDQTSYLVSGGILGLGITFAGGFLYFGSWLARIAADQRESADKLAETLMLLAESAARNEAPAALAAPAAPAAHAAPAEVASVVAPAAAATATVTRPVPTPARAKDAAAATLVVAGRGKTVHRTDCDLIAGREDLKPAGSDITDLIPCRLCQS